jgi:hypothetical protein
LKGGGELFEKGFHTVLFIREDIDDGSLREDQFLQVLKGLLLSGGLFHKLNYIEIRIKGQLFLKIN